MPYTFHFSNKTSPVIDSAILSKTVGVITATLGGVLLLKYIFNKQDNNKIVDELYKIQDLLGTTKQDDDEQDGDFDDSNLDEETKKNIKKKLEVIPLEDIEENIDEFIENETKKEITELSIAMKKAEKYKIIGAEVPKGIILTGCDEIDKDTFIKTFANEARRKIVKIDMLDLVDKYDSVLKDHDEILDSIFKKIEEQGKSSMILIENVVFNTENFNKNPAKSIVKVINQLLDGIFKIDENLFVILNSTFGDIDDDETEISIEFEGRIAHSGRCYAQSGRNFKLIHLEKPNFKERLELIQKFRVVQLIVYT